MNIETAMFSGSIQPEMYNPDADQSSSVYSDTQFKILKKYIQNFEQSLDSEHEVALKLTNFGQSVTMVVTDIWYENSVVLVFKGLVGNKESILIQHVSQLNLMLTSADRASGRQKRPIGFQAPSIS